MGNDNYCKVNIQQIVKDKNKKERAVENKASLSSANNVEAEKNILKGKDGLENISSVKRMRERKSMCKDEDLLHKSERKNVQSKREY